MAITLAETLKLGLFSVQNPRRGARAVLGLDLPLPARWIALAFTAVASALLTHLALALSVTPAEAGMLPGPVALALMQAGVMVLTALAIWQIGRWRGGRGRVEDAVLLMAWLQFILLCLQVAQIVLMLVAPLLADVIGLTGLVLFLWLLTGFVAELHGFSSLGTVFAGILGAMFALAMVLSVLLAIFTGSPA